MALPVLRKLCQEVLVRRRVLLIREPVVPDLRKSVPSLYLLS